MIDRVGFNRREHEGRMTTNIKLYGSKSERFQEIKDDIAERLGYEPSNAEVTGLLMAGYTGDGAGRSLPESIEE